MEKEQLGHVSIYWGDGKGKTTAALGTAVRAVGNGYTVHLIQCMKNGAGDPELELPGEIRTLRHLQGFSYRRFGTGSWVIGKPNTEHKQAMLDALQHLRECFGKYDILIADEFLYAVQLGLVSEDDMSALIADKPKNQELILTGSHKPLLTLFEKADLVTEIKKIKHPYDTGILARKGLEY